MVYRFLIFLITSYLFSYVGYSQIILNVQETFQEENQWCWAACSSCIMQHYGDSITQCEIAEYTRTVATWHDYGDINCCTDPSQGCNYWNYAWGYEGSIQEILVHFSEIVNSEVYSYLSLDTIIAELDDNRPFLIRWALVGGGGHFVIGHGISGNSLYYMNPWYGEGKKISDYSWVIDDGDHFWTHSIILRTSPDGDQSNIINLNSLSSENYCCGAAIALQYTIEGTYNSGNVFTAQLSNSSGDFSNPVNIGSLASTTAGTIYTTIPFNTTYGTGYRIRVVSSNPNVISNTNSNNLIINPKPTPMIIGCSFACQNSLESFSISTSAGRTYKWSATNGIIQGDDYGAFVNIKMGIGDSTVVKIIETIDATGCKDSVTKKIILNNLPIPEITGNNMVCANNLYTYSCNTSTGDNSKWIVCGGEIIGPDYGDHVDIIWDTISNGKVRLIQTNIASGCKDSIEVEITIHTSPHPQIADAPSIVCAENQYTYTGNIAIGVTNKWIVNGGDINGNDNGETVNIIWGTGNNGNLILIQTNLITGCMDSTNVHTIITPLPSPSISGKKSVCLGTSASYFSNKGTGLSNKWIVSGGSISNLNDGDSVQIDWETEGIGLLKLFQTNSNNCTDSSEMAVTINPIPHVTFVSSIKEFCTIDTTILLTGGSPVGGNYSGRGVVNGGFNPKNAGVGLHEIIYNFMSNDGCEDNAKENFLVNPASDKPTITENNRSLASSTSAIYQWYFENDEIEGETKQHFTPGATGNYKVEVGNQYNCKTMSDPYYFVISSIEESSKSTISIIPNPFNGYAKISWFMESQGSVSLIISDLLGKEVFSYNKNLEAGQHSIEFDACNIQAGIYFCTLKTKGKTETVKIVVF